MYRSLPTLVLSLLSLSPAAHAGSAPDLDPPAQPETPLPEVRVRARAQQTAKTPVPGYLAERSATATRIDLPLAETPQSISVIGAGQIRDQNAQTLQEVLRYTAGVHADVYGLDNRGDWFLLRGGSEGSTLLDGLRRPLTGWYGVVRSEPFAFERVEVLRGPSSVIAGQNGPGGVVNLVSKRPQAQSMNEVNLQAGNNAHKQVSLDLTGPLDAEGTLLYRVVALAKDSDTQVRHADEERQFVAPSLTWRPGKDASLTVYAEYQRDRSRNTEGFFPVEGTLRPGPHGYIPMDTFISEPDWDVYGGTRTRVGYQAEFHLGDAWTLRQDLRHDEVKGRQRSMYANYWEGFLADGRSLNRTWYATDDKGSITNADLLLEGRLQWGAVRHTVLLGLDGMSQTNSKKYGSGAATPLDVYTPTYGAFPHPELIGDATVTRTRQLGLSAQDQLKLGDQWVVLAGLRRDQARTEVVDSPAEGSDDAAVSRNLGVVYLAGGGWSPYANYSESFESVAGVDVHGTPFKPMRGRQFEAGVKWAPAGARFAATAAAYRLKETNRLTADPSDPSNQVQGGEVTVKGVELEANANLPAWDLVAKCAYTLAKVTGSSDPLDATLGKRVPNVPERTASLWAVHKFRVHGWPGLKAGLGLRYVGATWDGTDSLETPSNTLVDALVSYEKGAWRYALNASNLLDKTYFAACLNRGDVWFGTRRKVIATLSYRF